VFVSTLEHKNISVNKEVRQATVLLTSSFNSCLLELRQKFQEDLKSLLERGYKETKTHKNTGIRKSNDDLRGSLSSNKSRKENDPSKKEDPLFKLLPESTIIDKP